MPPKKQIDTSAGAINTKHIDTSAGAINTILEKTKKAMLKGSPYAAAPGMAIANLITIEGVGGCIEGGVGVHFPRTIFPRKICPRKWL